MKPPRRRAAHLGTVVMDGKPWKVTFKAGLLRFRPLRARREMTLSLADCARLLPGQSILPLHEQPTIDR